MKVSFDGRYETVYAEEVGADNCNQNPISLAYVRADRSREAWRPPSTSRGTLP